MADTNDQSQLHRNNIPKIAILDFGSQYSHLIARRVREMNVFCELFSFDASIEILFRGEVVGIILSGGPSSVYEENAPHMKHEVWNVIAQHQIPVLGICYGMQEIAHVFGGSVVRAKKREYGRAEVRKLSSMNSPLLDQLEDNFTMWMSHGDKLSSIPQGFFDVAVTDNSDHAVIENIEKKIWGVQFHPEVVHSPRGTQILSNFVVNVCRAPQTWRMDSITDIFIQEIREKVGDRRVIGAVSGGVDSTVAAVLMSRAIGDKFHAVLVDNGCLRLNESPMVVQNLQNLGINLHLIDARSQFMEGLCGVVEPEEKRRVIGRLFIEVFHDYASKIEKCDFLLQGTLYPDVIESISYKGPSATIKTHHNVGGLPSVMKLELIEPLRELFKDEVRILGLSLGIDKESIYRHPFPGPGLAIRILGEVTPERVARLQLADNILIEEIRNAGLYYNIAQAFVVLTDSLSVGVMGDCRTYESVCAIRCVQSTDFMTADWYPMPYDILAKISSRIINEVQGINRVVYDVSSKPPATIEWE